MRLGAVFSALVSARRLTAWGYGRHESERVGIVESLTSSRYDDLYLGDCGLHVAWCDGDDCARVRRCVAVKEKRTVHESNHVNTGFNKKTRRRHSGD